MPLVPCPACTHGVSDQAPFCPQCGHPLQPARAEPPAPPAAAISEPETAPEPADPLRCICGTWNRDGDVRCVSCRRALGQTTTRRRPVQYVQTPPLAPPVRTPMERERELRDEESANTLATISVVCALIAFFVWPIVFVPVALACGIPAYLRGSRRGLTGVILAILAMVAALLVALVYQ
jgi:hypothetical protein